MSRDGYLDELPLSEFILAILAHGIQDHTVLSVGQGADGDG